MAAQRADAVRSRERVLAVAKDVIDRDGPAVSLDRVARAAGVGSATLYRHFPTRLHLLEAVFAQEAHALAAAAAALPGSQDGASAVRSWARRLVVEAIASRGLGAALVAAGIEQTSSSDCRGLIARATDTLLHDPAVAASVRPGVRGEDVVDIASALAVVAEGDAERACRLMDQCLAGFVAEAR
ncbi:helix-turn-helix domain-containing protein [Nocardioides sp. QY071]|uniref:TetR/AcrR family transcriptional regulator n=1 Tax=Nocardioides sp. QY071 TaxID=3044187 RepID=UPI002499D102|nr:helix-turn-helix domain-containing protein [Nocardioides sp. QY071]WGY00347.1 helix-turn-helix domain-containing protein [Nocardioides sp. QY071]